MMRVGVVGIAVAGEGEGEGGVHARTGEDAEQVGEVAGLLFLIPGQLGSQRGRPGRAVYHGPAHGAFAGGAAVGAAAELGDRQRLAVPEVGLELAAEAGGVGGATVQVGADDIEDRPVHLLPLAGGVGDRAGELGPDYFRRVGEEPAEVPVPRSLDRGAEQ